MRVPLAALFDIKRNDLICREKTRVASITLYPGAKVGRGIFVAGVNLWKRRHQDLWVEYDDANECHIIKGFYGETEEWY